MTRLFAPFILIAAAIGLFVLFTNPIYQNIKSLQVQDTSYNDALSKAQQLHTVRDQLLTKRNSFSTTDITKLQSILPDNVDNIRLIIDINTIASRHNLALTNVNLGDLTKNATTITNGAGGTSPIGSVDIGFSVSTANYTDFLGFLQDLEHSLRLVDVVKLTFTSSGTSGVTTYSLSVRTYWLN